MFIIVSFLKLFCSTDEICVVAVDSFMLNESKNEPVRMVCRVFLDTACFAVLSPFSSLILSDFQGELIVNEVSVVMNTHNYSNNCVTQCYM